MLPYKREPLPRWADVLSHWMVKVLKAKAKG